MYNSHKGFTLIELLVAVALFTVVMMIAISTLLSIVDADRKAQSMQSIVDSLQFALDDMSRNIITGTTFHCDSSGSMSSLTVPQDCGAGSTYLSVEGSHGSLSDSNDQIVYWYSAGTCKTGPGGTSLPKYIGGCIEKSTASAAPGSWSPLTPPEVSVDSMQFYVDGALPSGPLTADYKQPHAYAVLTAHVDLPGGRTTTLRLQTSFTQRVFDQ